MFRMNMPTGKRLFDTKSSCQKKQRQTTTGQEMVRSSYFRRSSLASPWRLLVGGALIHAQLLIQRGLVPALILAGEGLRPFLSTRTSSSHQTRPSNTSDAEESHEGTPMEVRYGLAGLTLTFTGPPATQCIPVSDHYCMTNTLAGWCLFTYRTSIHHPPPTSPSSSIDTLQGSPCVHPGFRMTRPPPHSQYPLERLSISARQGWSRPGSRAPSALQPPVWRHMMHL